MSYSKVFQNFFVWKVNIIGINNQWKVSILTNLFYKFISLY